ncbi:MAG TPA: tRNA guanosine(34) transglycosylase Tgt [Bacteroidota bacterium]|nr:tRNA guanosine(34) transglycosylase Tgt [Bacteroidota bacterium]
MNFTLLHTDNTARAGLIQTDHGAIETPIFMPVGTQGTVKAVQQRELCDLGAQIILGNTYHLYLRPGCDVLRTMGGLHSFMNWKKPILTDSGGYQVFSLSDLRKISHDGVTFKSHLDGSSHFFSPQSVIEIERAIGSDIMMVLDECAPYPCDHAYSKKSNEMTVRWARQCLEHACAIGPYYDHTQALFAIVQGSVFKDIRAESADALTQMNFDGFAVGGLAVGEPADVMYDITEFTTARLPKDKPRYLMGVGTPENLLESIDRGIDMFDCVMPTRNGRNAMLFTSKGRMNMKNARWKTDSLPVDEECMCYACTTFSRGYIRHLFQVGEILALQLASVHNLTFYLRLVREARAQILAGTFAQWKSNKLQSFQQTQS